jgi:CDP-glucose 4,6-dehydratase
MNAAFWRGKRIFLTGHTGFKGSWLALWLQQLGAEVTGYALEPPTQPSLFELANVAKGMVSLQSDVRDFAALHHALGEAQPQIVIHMAAQSLVRASYADPVGTYATNVMGTVNLLEAVRQSGGVRVTLNVTSDKCYDNKEWIWPYREVDPMGGHDPYSSSKGCAELVTAAFRRSFFAGGKPGAGGTLLASARAGNVIGGGDWAAERLVPDIMRAFMAGQPALIRNPNAVRPWQHVLDPLAGYLLLIERLWEEGAAFAGGWNFGPASEDTRPVSWVVERCVELWGDNARWELSRGEHPHEAQMLSLDCSKARSVLRWRPNFDVSTAMQRTVNWYQRMNSGEDARDLCMEQIAQYDQEPA